MNITKYGMAYCCGYGWFSSFSYCSNSFNTCVTVMAESKTTTVSGRQLNWEPQCMAGIGASGIGSRIFVVFDSDSDKWKEYFSGMTIEVAYNNYASMYGTYNVDNPHYNNLCPTLSMAAPYECSAVAFAEAVSGYTDNQIRQIVATLRKLSEDAAKWKHELEKLIAEVKDERERKEKGLPDVESQLASGFGKYSAYSFESTQDESKAKQDESKAKQDEPKAKQEQPSEQKAPLRWPASLNQEHAWIREGRCAYCGGEFKGLIKKVCRDCGKAKSY